MMQIYIRFKAADGEIRTHWMSFEKALDTVEANWVRIQKHCPEFVWSNRVYCSYLKRVHGCHGYGF